MVKDFQDFRCTHFVLVIISYYIREALLGKAIAYRVDNLHVTCLIDIFFTHSEGESSHKE